jgi:hypothetical protein
VTAMRMPKIKELKQLPLVGEILGPLFDVAGITDDDLPDIIRDDIDYTDRSAIEQHMPKVAAKLHALEESS